MAPESPASHVSSYYAASANRRTDHPELSGEVRADVCVVGAGFTGLNAALDLAERGFDVAVVEAARVGWGASGRNGGQINSGYAPGMAKVVRWYGEAEARRLWAMAEEAKAMIAERVRRHAIACDLKPGFLYAAAKRGHVAELAKEIELYRRVLDYDKMSLVDGEAVKARIASPRFHGALYDAGAGHLHPLNYCLGLGEAAAAAGVRIFERSRAVRLEPGEPATVRTAGGRVVADHVILAGNAYLGDLAPQLEPRIMPVGTFICATEPLGENRARALLPGDECVCDSNFVLDYFRLSADRRMLFGGRVSYTGRESLPWLGRAMRRRLLNTFPQLADVRIDYVWGGFVAITRNRLPDLGRLHPNVYYAQGFSGQGVALTGLAGKVIAEAVAGTAERFDVFARIRHRAFPGGVRLRTPALVLATTWYRLRDLLG